MVTPPAPPPGPPPPPVPGLPEPESSPSFLARRLAVTIAAVAVLLGLGLYVTAYASAGSEVKKGTTVLGIDIGGLSRPDAESKLTTELPAVISSKVTVTAADKTFTLDTVKSGLAVDARATVERAGERSLNPGVVFPVLFGAKDNLQPVLSVDEAALNAVVEGIAKKVNQKAREGRVKFEGGQAVASKPREARTLLVAETAQALREAYTSGATSVTAPVQSTPPVVGQAEVDRVMKEFATPAMSGPVTVSLNGQAISLSTAKLDDYLKISVNGPTLSWTVNTDKMATDVAEDNPDVIKAPKDASFVFVRKKPKVVPGKDGEKIDPVSFGEQMRAALVSTTARTVAATAVPSEPDVTTAEAEGLGIVEQISTYRTNYPIAPYRVNNIGRAAELINEALVLPGEIFSLNDRIGERTEENGFVKGFVIDKGVFKEDLGGGVSQSATTVFNAVFFAGLKDIEHHTHSLYISRYPAGREATVAFGSKDLRFQNDTPTGILVRAVAKPGWIRVSIWGTKYYDKIESVSSERSDYKETTSITSAAPDCVPQSPVPGFEIDVTRVFYQGGKVVKREKFHTEYIPTDRITCTNPRPDDD
ncbi:VanW family protein [Sporichthya sp.]|uniref:VanW family protein n=1 Tax=Sporichthya sp. TaxID=65475 RepID=UPI0018218DFB|nr:VanW family protein [Sporichthya sp.]MBA3744873.1 VanW family protein [Sporichthya sp.]